MTDLTTLLEFFHRAERLKNELRHSYTSTGRQESVAEHTWRMALMALAVAPHLDRPIDLEKTLKMVIIHDLVEIEAGDVPIPFMVNNPELLRKKEAMEQEAIERIRTMLGPPLGDEVASLWNEFETRSSYEAKVAYALDKLEVQLQHNEADLSTWIPLEHQLIYYRKKYTAFDSGMDALRTLIEQEAEKKLSDAGINIEALRKSAKDF